MRLKEEKNLKINITIIVFYKLKKVMETSKKTIKEIESQIKEIEQSLDNGKLHDYPMAITALHQSLRELKQQLKDLK